MSFFSFTHNLAWGEHQKNELRNVAGNGFGPGFATLLAACCYDGSWCEFGAESSAFARAILALFWCLSGPKRHVYVETLAPRPVMVAQKRTRQPSPCNSVRPRFRNQ